MKTHVNVSVDVMRVTSFVVSETVDIWSPLRHERGRTNVGAQEWGRADDGIVLNAFSVLSVEILTFPGQKTRTQRVVTDCVRILHTILPHSEPDVPDLGRGDASIRSWCEGASWKNAIETRHTPLT